MRKKFPSLLHGKRSAPELPLLPPASVRREDSSPSKRGRKPKKPKSPREFSFDLTADGSEDEQWTRRRSERIFLHDAAQATPISPSGKTPLPLTPKPARGPKASPQSPKELAKAKEVKDPNKVSPCFIDVDWVLCASPNETVRALDTSWCPATFVGQESLPLWVSCCWTQKDGCRLPGYNYQPSPFLTPNPLLFFFYSVQYMTAY